MEEEKRIVLDSSDELFTVPEIAKKLNKKQITLLLPDELYGALRKEAL